MKVSEFPVKATLIKVQKIYVSSFWWLTLVQTQLIHYQFIHKTIVLIFVNVVSIKCMRNYVVSMRP